MTCPQNGIRLPSARKSTTRSDVMAPFFFMILILSNVLFKFFGGKFFCDGFPETSVIDLLFELLAQSDDDALGTADVGKPILVFGLHHFAHQLDAVSEQSCDVVIDVSGRAHDALDPELVH